MAVSAVRQPTDRPKPGRRKRDRAPTTTWPSRSGDERKLAAQSARSRSGSSATLVRGARSKSAPAQAPTRASIGAYRGRTTRRANGAASDSSPAITTIAKGTKASNDAASLPTSIPRPPTLTGTCSPRAAAPAVQQTTVVRKPSTTRPSELTDSGGASMRRCCRPSRTVHAKRPKAAKAHVRELRALPPSSTPPIANRRPSRTGPARHHPAPSNRGVPTAVTPVRRSPWANAATPSSIAAVIASPRRSTNARAHMNATATAARRSPRASQRAASRVPVFGWRKGRTTASTIDTAESGRRPAVLEACSDQVQAA